MKKILVIGGSGYIGSRLVSYLEERYDVTSVDRGMFGLLDYPTKVLDYDELSAAFLSRYSHIILLAGHSCPGMCGNEMVSCWENNVSNFVRLLEKLDPETNLIYASTAAIYQHTNHSTRLSEDDEVGDSFDIYTLSKKTIEQISKFRKNTIGLRFGTVGGFSENFRGENFPNAISTSANKGKITISNPNLYRSILYIGDLCSAIETIIKQGIKSSIYNIVSFSDTILNISNHLSKHVGCGLDINDSMKTGYSFNCSSKRFELDYDFKFNGSIEMIYGDVINNYSKIKINVPREYVKYG